MRIDRALTLSVFGPLRGLFSPGTSASIPILMYHSIAPDVDDKLGPYYRTVTSPRVFARQIDLLRASGHAAIKLSEAIDLLRGASSESMLKQPSVVITFDDGFRDFYTDAFPILERAGFTATVFLPTDFIGRAFITGRECLTATEVRELSDMGIEFGSHSASHRRLVELRTDELAEELSSSKAAIEDIVGREVTLFSYPFRFPEENPQFTGTLARLLDECGYRGGVTTAIGRSNRLDNPRFLPRLPVNDCDDDSLLHAKLAGHYDWLRSGQRLRKQSRALWQKWAGA
jgi:peptidoglycan/xylan/chitin deacetylase (PgdA/CDA1 family)